MGEECDYDQIALDMVESLPGDINQKMTILRKAAMFMVSLAATEACDPAILAAARAFQS
jgi:hypothetical protein